MNCKNCNAVMRVDAERKLFICPYCNSTEPFDSTTKEEIRELLKDALEDANQESRRMMEQMIASHRQEVALAKEESGLKSVVVYVVLTVAACFTLIMTLFGLTTEYKASGVVALIQCILCFVAIFTRAGAKNSGNRRLSIVSNACALAAALLVIVWIVAITVTSPSKDEKTYMDDIYARDYYWPEEGYASVVPRYGEQPAYSYVGDREFSATIKPANEDTFNDYVKICAEQGFTIDVTSDAGSYNAYNDKDNELDVSFLESSEIMYIKLYDAIEWSPIVWPGQGSMKDVPKPDSEEAFIESMSTDFFKAYLNGFTREKYLDYIQKCMEAGFEGRYENGSNKFYGSKDKVSISLELKRNKVVLITVY